MFRISHTIAISLLALAFAHSVAADGKQISKSSRQEINVEKELSAFFDKLLHNDPDGRRQASAALSSIQIPAGWGLDTDRVPTVLRWYPSVQRPFVGGATFSDSTYLVLLPVGPTREAEGEKVTACLIGEFHVLYKATRKFDEKLGKQVLITNSAAFTFRGFRLSQSSTGSNL